MRERVLVDVRGPARLGSPHLAWRVYTAWLHHVLFVCFSEHDLVHQHANPVLERPLVGFASWIVSRGPPTSHRTLPISFCAFQTPCARNQRHRTDIRRLPRRHKSVPRCGADVPALLKVSTLPPRAWRRSRLLYAKGAESLLYCGRRRPSTSAAVTVRRHLELYKR